MLVANSSSGNNALAAMARRANGQTGEGVVQRRRPGGAHARESLRPSALPSPLPSSHGIAADAPLSDCLAALAAAFDFSASAEACDFRYSVAAYREENTACHDWPIPQHIGQWRYTPSSCT